MDSGLVRDIKDSHDSRLLEIYGINDSIMQMICELKTWTRIKICDCEISIPDEISKLTDLLILNLHGVKIICISEEITKLTNLTQIHLSGKYIDTIPEVITRIPNLARLLVTNVYLLVVPISIKNLQSVGYMYLENTVHIPDEFAELQQLSKFRYGTVAKYIPRNVYVHDNKMLVLKFNRSDTVPEGITHLNILDYNGGNLDCLPVSLEYLKIMELSRPLLNLPMNMKYVAVHWELFDSRFSHEIKLPYGCELSIIKHNFL
ncbi:MAG: hypothetical protein Gaeavirus39_2 [Gaeavirus sp.]|uniref:Leucine-rich repeat protein n=1 Tax=Gaeavirus sp. TaxID=2487767 RepID=A0A3G4ZZR4_9VIRU|nr:MAG: hypothetical protein Gaeavirus39_2 [Gaeavirus sp.]